MKNTLFHHGVCYDDGDDADDDNVDDDDVHAYDVPGNGLLPNRS